MTEPQEPDVDLDSLRRDQLGEIDPMHPVLADVLDEWLLRMHGITSGGHYVGAFLEFLAAQGYRVTPIEVPDLADLLPPPKE